MTPVAQGSSPLSLGAQLPDPWWSVRIQFDLVDNEQPVSIPSDWATVAALPGRRVTRRKTSGREFAFTDEDGILLGTAHRRRGLLHATLTTPQGTYQTRGNGLTGVRLMAQGHAEAAPTELMGISTLWLPDGRRLLAVASADARPKKVVSLLVDKTPVVTLRWIPSGKRLSALLGLQRCFDHGEAVITDPAVTPQSALPLLLLAFQMLQSVNQP